MKFRIDFDLRKERLLIATDSIIAGEIILEEKPLVCSQFLWNTEYGYDSCQYCLKPLETAEENASRLIGRKINLPHMEKCCATTNEEKLKHVSCVKGCGERYCSNECRQNAWCSHHETLCSFNLINSNSSTTEICQAWQSFHYPPETASIMLLLKLLANIKQSKNPQESIEKVLQFSCKYSKIEYSKKLVHKLLGDKFSEQLIVLRRLTTSIMKDEILEPFLTEDGFMSLMALIGTNGQGIGTSAFSEWAKNCERLLANNEEELSQINKLIDSLFDEMNEVSGPFLNNEGSGLYETHCFINHSCQPNAEVHFPYNNFILSLKAIENISSGQEISICYLDECWRDRSRHSRQKYLRDNYLFTCECIKCQNQINDPDVTSDEEEYEDLLSGDENMDQD